MDITKILTISTGHISENTRTMLDIEPHTDSMQLSVYTKGDYGWLIWVPDDCQNPNIPEDLQKCLQFAKDNECEWLCLDCDGEEINNFNQYNW